MRMGGWRKLSALAPLLLAAGCNSGDGEDFTVEVKRPAAVVYAPLSVGEVGEAHIAFPGVTIQRSRPSDGEILYTIPGDGDFPSTIGFRLEPVDGDRGTIIHASIHVPSLPVTIHGEQKVVSEKKAESVFEGLVKSMARSLEMGSSGESDARQLSEALTGLALATNRSSLTRALDLSDHPDKLAGLLLAFGAGEDSGPSTATGRDVPMIDPDATEEEHEAAQTRADWQQQEAAEKAAEPASDLNQYDR